VQSGRPAARSDRSACMHHTRSQALTAAQSGAAVLNHCEVVSLLTSGTPGEAGYRITGARLKARPEHKPPSVTARPRAASRGWVG
jgi:hypothetical protein